MQLYKGILFIGEFAGLVDNSVRYTDLAHIVEQSRPIDLFLFPVALSHPPGNLAAVVGNPHGMAPGIFVLGVYGFGQNLHNIIVKLLQFPAAILQFNHVAVGPVHFHKTEQHDNAEYHQAHTNTLYHDPDQIGVQPLIVHHHNHIPAIQYGIREHGNFLPAHLHIKTCAAG